MPYVDLENVNKSTVVSELKTVIGKKISQNQSPTLVAKLVKVGKVNCVFESVESDFWSDLDLDDDNDYSDSIDIEPHRNEEKYKYTVEYNGYNIEVDRNEYDWNGKHYIQSMIEITRDELTLRDMYRFEPDEYHPDGLITTGLPLDVTSKIDPISAEEKLIIKAKAIIDRLDEN